MSGAVVRLRGVSKRFCLTETHDSLAGLLAGAIRRLARRSAPTQQPSEFWALEDVSFDVAGGEALGIIGPNGAGKSTVLKLLAGILRPDQGTIAVRGRLAALIEIGAGFHGDLTGRENVFLNGAILGMPRREIRDKLDSIVAFAGLERFLDMPVKRYSSGMAARLGFSIAAHVDPEILLVDEVLSVGDAMFRLRCLERMHQLLAAGVTLVFVTHNLDQMTSICRRAVVLDGGRAVFDGLARDAVSHYLSAMSRAHASRPTDLIGGDTERGPAVELVDLRFRNERGELVRWVRTDEPLCLELRFRLCRPVKGLVLEMNMRATSHENLLSFNSGRSNCLWRGEPGEHRARVRLAQLGVCGGQYFWNVRVWDADRGTAEVDTAFRFPLVVDDNGLATGVLAVPHRWDWEIPCEERPVVEDDSLLPEPCGTGR